MKTLKMYFGCGCTDYTISNESVVHCKDISDFIESEHPWFYKSDGVIIFKERQDYFYMKLFGLNDLD